MTGKGKKIIDKMVMDIANDLIYSIQNALIEDNAVYTGKAMQSLIYDPESQAILSDSRALYTIEMGMRPGTWVPYDKLRDWVEFKVGPPSEQIDAVTERVRNKIHDEGIDPRMIIKGVLEKWANGSK